MLHKCSSYWAGWGLGGPGRAADAVAVVSVVRGQAGWAGREGGGHREGTARRGWLGCTLLGGAAAVTAVVAVLELAKNQCFACKSSSLECVKLVSSIYTFPSNISTFDVRQCKKTKQNCGTRNILKLHF